jgi:hypothetical protein
MNLSLTIMGGVAAETITRKSRKRPTLVAVKRSDKKGQNESQSMYLF